MQNASYAGSTALATNSANSDISSNMPLPRVSLVIPTLNEADNLAWLLPRLPSWIFELLIVDGCSTDGTVEVVRRLYPGARIITEKRRGKGVALMTGFEAAAGDIIVMLDADGSMDPEEIILYVATLMSGADFVKGSRFIQGAGTVDMTLIRKLGNWGLTMAVRTLYGGSFSDLCYGYVAFWKRCFPVLRSDCSGFEVETILNIKALQNKLKIVEVASFESVRIHGESNLRALPDGWRILKAILRERVTPKALAPAPAE
ncbi:glycosyltransferase family 2 protein [Rhodoblastus sp.]|uniref:glycosyltransferase family 2 protein n=1 Tax=Rhodoblastus sp. TaxID=1962975 RepID=UPI0025DF8475|nr:glycosyltransferase family 2 protein [Rhodoblastus sp.]